MTEYEPDSWLPLSNRWFILMSLITSSILKHYFDTISLSLILTKAFFSSEHEFKLSHQLQMINLSFFSLPIFSMIGWWDIHNLLNWKHLHTGTSFLLSKSFIQLTDPYLFILICFIMNSLHLRPWFCLLGSWQCFLVLHIVNTVLTP